jgi:hypothetical protein
MCFVLFYCISVGVFFVRSYDPIRQRYMSKLLILTLSFLSLLHSCRAQQVSDFEPVAVVELFTSEGCSSCPPADRLLAKLAVETGKGHKKIYTLSFHVDYWNRLGWKDPFSSSKYSDRQQQYASALRLTSVYTPQMIVNGQYELVGSDEPKLDETIARALRHKTSLTFTSLAINANDGSKITVHYELKGNPDGCQIHFALVSKHESTAVRHGENSGRQLDHTNVVRQFVTAAASQRGDASLDIATGSDLSSMLIIAYIQRMSDTQIIAASSIQP